MATKPFLVVILSRETPFFGDEPCSRRHFKPRNPIFWRRDLISSPFRGEKLDFLATKPCSRRHFEPRNPLFWRRALFSSPFWGEKVVFLAARLVLVVVFRSESRFFGDET
ncbi:hypothetical protein NST61_03850 [Caldifermentibacillus hisashii]|uniref:hypothetical protein n=1 Tax=Caldifermentibacillus hisashii TaxID=996558 RepID=UPI0034D4D9F3